MHSGFSCYSPWINDQFSRANPNFRMDNRTADWLEFYIWDRIDRRLVKNNKLPDLAVTKFYLNPGDYKMRVVKGFTGKGRAERIVDFTLKPGVLNNFIINPDNIEETFSAYSTTQG